jgi:hypothetical protein
MPAQSPVDTVCLRRIAELPRRKLSEGEAVTWADALTEEFRAPGSLERLRPMQAMALVEAAQNDGAFLALPVGFGKTLITWLLPLLLGARRPLLIVPGTALVEKTLDDFRGYRGQWRTPNPPPVVRTKESFQVESGWDFLARMCPDLIVIDEADELANADRGTPRKIDRYVVEGVRHARTGALLGGGPLVYVDANGREVDGPGEGRVLQSGVRAVVLTGTPTRTSIMGYWHLLMWALRERAPLPLDRNEARSWARALDHKPGRLGRADVGALVHLSATLTNGKWVGSCAPTLDAVRAEYFRRFSETPGVMLIDGDSCDQPLHITVRVARECPVLNEHFAAFALQKITPGGVMVSDSLSRYNLEAQLGCGYYHVQFDASKRTTLVRWLRGGCRGVPELDAVEWSLIQAAANGHPEKLAIPLGAAVAEQLAPDLSAVRGLPDEWILAGVRRRPLDVTERTLAEAVAVLGLPVRGDPNVFAACLEVCRPPIMWRVARRDVSGFVRGCIERSTGSSRPLDTEGDVFRAHPRNVVVLAWLAWAELFAPSTMPVWLSTATVEDAAAWAKESSDPGIIWVGGVEFASALVLATGLPYYGRDGTDARTGRRLHRADPTSTMIVSWNANKKGFNLQPWSRQAVFMPPQSAKWLEQMFGRSHRSGAERPVHIDFFATSGCVLDAFEAAVGEAEFAQETMGLTQKILRAAIVRGTPRVTPANEWRWASRS